MSIIVWFNGLSSQKFIKTLPKQNIEIGTNYITNLRNVNCVCAYDTDVVLKIKTLPNVKYYTVPHGQTPGWQVIRDTRVQGTNSGILALYLAVQQNETVYIIGCDWGINEKSTQDEYYKKDYYPRKYTNNIKRRMSELCKNKNVFVVNDQKVDVPLPIISTNYYLEITNYK